MLFSLLYGLDDYPDDIQQIMDRGYLEVAVLNHDDVPFIHFDPADSSLSGYDIDLARKIAHYLGVECRFKPVAASYNELAELIATGCADLAIGYLSYTPERAKHILFTAPYLQFKMGMLINRMYLSREFKKRSEEDIIRNFNGRLGVEAGASYVEYARLVFPAAEILTFASWPDLVRATADNRVDAAFSNNFDIQKIIIDNPEFSLRLKTVIFKDFTDDIAIALPWKNHHLHYWLDYFLELYHFTAEAQDLIDYLQKMTYPGQMASEE